MLIVAIVMFIISLSSSGGSVTADQIVATPIPDLQRRLVESPIPQITCTAAWNEAASISSDDIQDASEDLNPPVRSCNSLAEWYSESTKHPELLRGKSSIEVLIERCTNEPATAEICEWIRMNPERVESELR